MDLTELLETLDDDARKIVDELAEKAADTTAADELATLKALEDPDEVLLALDFEPADDDTDPVLKGVDAEVRERIEKAEARVAKMEDDNARDTLVAVAKSEMSGLTETSDDIGAVLHTVAKTLGSDSDGYKSLERVLKSASAQADEAMGILGAEQGSNATTAPDGETGLRARIAELVEKGVNPADAFRQAVSDNPELAAAAVERK